MILGARLRLHPVLHPAALRRARPDRPEPPRGGPRPRREPVPHVPARDPAAVEDRHPRRRVLIALPMFGDYYTPDIVSGAPTTSMIGNQIDLYFHGGAAADDRRGAHGRARRLFLVVLMAYYLWTIHRATQERADRMSDGRRTLGASRGSRPGAGSAAGSRTRGADLASWPCSPGLYMVWSLVPVLIAIQFSFNDGRVAHGLAGLLDPLVLGRPGRLGLARPGPARRAGPEPEAGRRRRADRDAARRPAGARPGPLARPRLEAAPTSSCSSRWSRPRSSWASRCSSSSPHLFTSSAPGTTAQILGHVTFSISYVVVIVRGRLFSIGQTVRGGGRRPRRVARPSRSTRVLLPLLCRRSSPARRSCSRISIDDFVISQWLSSGADTDTVPIQIYAATRAAPLPSTNAHRDDHGAHHARLGRRPASSSGGSSPAASGAAAGGGRRRRAAFEMR